jgi:hypothetical protein
LHLHSHWVWSALFDGGVGVGVPVSQSNAVAGAETKKQLEGFIVQEALPHVPSVWLFAQHCPESLPPLIPLQYHCHWVWVAFRFIWLGGAGSGFPAEQSCMYA